ncbi:unnamed protein product [Thlaspi arvense]|uniref:BED-type domain-containing protein n=1 Tax=Thlaspi arvense TaxID=13288 RepID=A0AAU9RT49_THLAR|nr:unnamed protein product [Thlaspi arvense]
MHMRLTVKPRTSFAGLSPLSQAIDSRASDELCWRLTIEPRMSFASRAAECESTVAGCWNPLAGCRKASLSPLFSPLLSVKHPAGPVLQLLSSTQEMWGFFLLRGGACLIKMSSSKGSADPAWKYCKKVDPKQANKVMCNFCGKITAGGITRAKYHFIGGNRHVSICQSCPETVKQEIRQNMIQKEEVKSHQVLVPPTQHNYEDYDLMEDETEDDVSPKATHSTLTLTKPLGWSPQEPFPHKALKLTILLKRKKRDNSRERKEERALLLKAWFACYKWEGEAPIYRGNQWQSCKYAKLPEVSGASGRVAPRHAPACAAPRGATLIVSTTHLGATCSWHAPACVARVPGVCCRVSSVCPSELSSELAADLSCHICTICHVSDQSATSAVSLEASPPWPLSGARHAPGAPVLRCSAP